MKGNESDNSSSNVTKKWTGALFSKSTNNLLNTDKTPPSPNKSLSIGGSPSPHQQTSTKKAIASFGSGWVSGSSFSTTPPSPLSSPRRENNVLRSSVKEGTKSPLKFTSPNSSPSHSVSSTPSKSTKTKAHKTTSVLHLAELVPSPSPLRSSKPSFKLLHKQMVSIFKVLNDHLCGVVDNISYRERRGNERFVGASRMLIACRNAMKTMVLVRSARRTRPRTSSTSSVNSTSSMDSGVSRHNDIMNHHIHVSTILKDLEEDVQRIVNEAAENDIELGHFQEMNASVRSISGTISALLDGINNEISRTQTSSGASANSPPSGNNSTSNINYNLRSSTDSSMTDQYNTPDSSVIESRRAGTVESIKSKYESMMTEPKSHHSHIPSEIQFTRRPSLIMNNYFIEADKKTKRADDSNSQTSFSTFATGSPLIPLRKASAASDLQSNSSTSSPFGLSPLNSSRRQFSHATLGRLGGTRLPKGRRNSGIYPPEGIPSRNEKIISSTGNRVIKRQASEDNTRGKDGETTNFRDRSRSRSFANMNEMFRREGLVLNNEVQKTTADSPTSVPKFNAPHVSSPPAALLKGFEETKEVKRKSQRIAATNSDEVLLQQDVTSPSSVKHRQRVINFQFGLQKILMHQDFEVITALCNELLLKSTSELAPSIIEFYLRTGGITDLLKKFMTFEVKNTKTLSVLFRGESPTTQLFSAFLKRAGRQYLSQLVEPTIQAIIQEASQPNAFAPESESDSLAKASDMKVLGLLQTIIASIENCPKPFRELLQHAHTEVVQQFGNHFYVVQTLLFLRFVCPALVNPESYFNLSIPTFDAFQELIKISKKIQTIANNLSTSQDASDLPSQLIKKIVDKIMSNSSQLRKVSSSSMYLSGESAELLIPRSDCTVPAKKWEEDLDLIFELIKNNIEAVVNRIHKDSPLWTEEKEEMVKELRYLVSSGNPNSGMNNKVSSSHSHSNRLSTIFGRKDKKTSSEAQFAELRKALEEEREQKLMYQHIVLHLIRQNEMLKSKDSWKKMESQEPPKKHLNSEDPPVLTKQNSSSGSIIQQAMIFSSAKAVSPEVARKNSNNWMKKSGDQISFSSQQPGQVNRPRSQSPIYPKSPSPILGKSSSKHSQKSLSRNSSSGEPSPVSPRSPRISDASRQLFKDEVEPVPDFAPVAFVNPPKLSKSGSNASSNSLKTALFGSSSSKNISSGSIRSTVDLNRVDTKSISRSGSQNAENTSIREENNAQRPGSAPQTLSRQPSNSAPARNFSDSELIMNPEPPAINDIIPQEESELMVLEESTNQFPVGSRVTIEHPIVRTSSRGKSSPKKEVNITEQFINSSPPLERSASTTKQKFMERKTESSPKRHESTRAIHRPRNVKSADKAPSKSADQNETISVIGRSGSSSMPTSPKKDKEKHSRGRKSHDEKKDCIIQ
eukprot:TRINITY_DN1918_c0_g1_i1.p1 TRINITY_DN1918_c0_g1~~TRINITY_DN1918_c0_g1_i1.p1  ORF type:complete len:1420 (-),score=454.15 TRINITY_DN1918_c0_g1_i1:85-4344(-)